MRSSANIKAWADSRLVLARSKLEVLGLGESEYDALRGRIAELKELLVALEDKALPVWIDASQDASGL